MKQNVVYVNMLGDFTLTYGDKQLVCSNRSKLIWNIMAYLLCHRGEFISSDTLISAIWKSEKNDNPSGAMRTAIHRARSVLSELTADEDCKLLISKNGGYAWNPDVDVVMDTDLFEKTLTELSGNGTPEELQTCLSALELYNGKFLTALSSELWVLPLQAYYHNLYETAVERVLPELEREGRHAEGVELCRKTLQIDPYSEKMYQYLMRFLLVLDDRQEVIRVYEQMSKLLLSTFGVMPDQESRSLYREAIQSTAVNMSITPETLQDQLREQEEICGALICDFDFFKMLYQAQARTLVRSGAVVHTALLTLKSRNKKEASAKSVSLAMDNLEKHMHSALRKGDVITRCSASQFIVMLPSANYENSCKVCQRCITVFERKHPHSPVYVDYYVQPLIPSTKS